MKPLVAAPVLALAASDAGAQKVAGTLPASVAHNVRAFDAYAQIRLISTFWAIPTRRRATVRGSPWPR